MSLLSTVKWHRRCIFFWSPCLLVSWSLLLSSCISTQPVAKIGLIAPFEGLYRRSGYEALAAMRAAIADHPTPGMGIIPLALDDSGDPALARRAMAKLLVDPAVAALVGPLAPAEAVAASGAILAAETAAPPWHLPFAPATGPAPFASTQPADGWASGLVRRAAELASDQGAQGLVLAGWTPGWPELTAARWSELAGLPVRQVEAPVQVQLGEAVFWLGSPDGGAAYLAELRRHHPQAPFWLGPQGGDPVFAEHAQMFDQVYWVIWTDPGYHDWSTAHTPSSPAAYLVYRATVDAIDGIAGAPSAPRDEWFVQVYALDSDGVSVRYPPIP